MKEIYLEYNYYKKTKLLNMLKKHNVKSINLETIVFKESLKTEIIKILKEAVKIEKNLFEIDNIEDVFILELYKLIFDILEKSHISKKLNFIVNYVNLVNLYMETVVTKVKVDFIKLANDVSFKIYDLIYKEIGNFETNLTTLITTEDLKFNKNYIYFANINSITLIRFNEK